MSRTLTLYNKQQSENKYIQSEHLLTLHKKQQSENNNENREGRVRGRKKTSKHWESFSVKVIPRSVLTILPFVGIPSAHCNLIREGKASLQEIQL